MSDPQNPNETTPANDGAGSWQSYDPNTAGQNTTGQPPTGQDAVNQVYGQQSAPDQQFQQPSAQFPQNGQVPPASQFPPAGAAAAGSSVPAKTGNRVLKRILAIVVVLVLVIGGSLLYSWYTTSHDTTKDVGHCVALSGTEDDVETERVDCGTDGAYYVAKAGSDETCTDVADTAMNTGGAYDQITITSGGSRASMCLVPEWTEDSCYPADSSGLNYHSVDCKSTEAYVHIDEIIEEYDATCPDTSAGGLTYDEPARTYCVSTPE